MSKENGVIDDVEIIPDFENEMIEETPPVQKSGGCGCNKNKANRINNIPPLNRLLLSQFLAN